jgi:hypothetical protein
MKIALTATQAYGIFKAQSPRKNWEIVHCGKASLQVTGL